MSARQAVERTDRRRGRRDVLSPVAVVLSRFPTVTETFILREIREMERQGQPVTLVPLLRDDPPVLHEEAKPWTGRALFTPFLSLRIVAANVRALLDAPVTYLSVLATLVAGMIKSPGFLLRSLALFPKSVDLAQRLESEGIHHVHAHFATHPTTAAWIMTHFSNLTFSVTVHAHDIFVDQTFLGPKLEAARFVRVISEFNRQYLLSRLPDLDPDDVRIVHVGIDVDQYASDGRSDGTAADPAPPDRDRNGSRSGADVPLVLTVASLRPYKGIPVLLEACGILRDAGVDIRVDVAGDGPLRNELESRIARQGIEDRVRFLGAVPEDEVPGLLSRASIFVLPSVMQEDGQMDGIPVALMEAMAAGIPVVTSDLSGIPELVEHGDSGLVLPPGDADAVATAIRSLLERPGWADALGKRGRKRIGEAFALEACTARLLELLREHVGTVTSRIQERLRNSDALWRQTRAVGVRRVHEGRDSWVAELLLRAGPPDRGGELDRHDFGAPVGEEIGLEGEDREPWPREVVMKVHRSRPDASRPAPDRARTEFEVLRSLTTSEAREAPSVPERETPVEGVEPERCGPPAPRALHLDETAAALVMSRCPGDSLLDLARAARWSRNGEHTGEARDAFRRTGMWLWSFQTRTRARGSADRALDRATVEGLEAVNGLRDGLLDPREVRSLEERLLELRGEAGNDATLVRRHGDFWPGNVHVSSEGPVSVLDFEGADEGHPLEDPAYFALHLSIYFAYPGLGRRRRDLETAFLEGYGDPSMGRSPAFELCRRAAAAKLLQDDGGRIRLVPPTRWFTRRALLATLRGERP